MSGYSGDRGFEPIALLVRQIVAELWYQRALTNAPDRGQQPLVDHGHGKPVGYVATAHALNPRNQSPMQAQGHSGSRIPGSLGSKLFTAPVLPSFP